MKTKEEIEAHFINEAKEAMNFFTDKEKLILYLFQSAKIMHLELTLLKINSNEALR